jgi:hypothetical protein
VSRRLSSALYAGATGRSLSLSDVAKFGSKFVLAPKLDGSYTHVSFSSDGRLSAIVTRNGELLPRKIAADFHGVRWVPDSVIVAECEVWTEAANRIAERRGYRVLHVFDVLRCAGRDVSALPWGERFDWLMRAESWLVGEGRDRPWLTDATGRAHDPATGRYTRPTPLSWRRVRVAPRVPVHRADAAWADWVERDALDAPVEGLVVCALHGKLGSRGSKKRVKRADTIDAVALKVDDGGALMLWTARGITFTVGARKSVPLVEGATYTVGCEGWYSGSGDVPRFPRVLRSRPDLSKSL